MTYLTKLFAKTGFQGELVLHTVDLFQRAKEVIELFTVFSEKTQERHKRKTRVFNCPCRLNRHCRQPCYSASSSCPHQRHHHGLPFEPRPAFF